MNLPSFIANRISGKDKENLSGPAVRVSVFTIALGLAIMILAVSVLVGFQKEIRNKVIGFSAHIQIDNFDDNTSFESQPIPADQPFYAELKGTPGIRHIQVFGLKAGIIKTQDQLQGVILKGVGPDYDWNFMKNHLAEGEIITLEDSAASSGILISRLMASKLKIIPGDEVRMYFVSGSDSQPRGRKFTVAGIYETGLEEFDEMYVIADIRHIRRLNNWEPGMVSGFEVFIDDFDNIDEMGEKVYQTIGYDLNAETIVQKYPQIFDWLRLMDINVVIILVLMILVAGITIISTLLILILERTSMIGILKALGTKDRNLRKMFIFLTGRIIAKGLFWGNLAGVGIGLLQFYFRIIPLDQESYYMAYVPVSLMLWQILLINLVTVVTCLVMVLIPGYIIGRITPVKAIRYR
ncbi:MAG TPA: ABC transporter permease [Bacteroidales bacterium]|nr:ABC transporter permease [Bacteroidales bacterium]HOX78150.1 ABC transporter permease [Bacteroidales bacterium]HPI86710.1 ABC transporter permease [Bacteroidales bacterium]HPM92093.1 ABC transporter permease [Bacteroidales bacterium]